MGKRPLPLCKVHVNTLCHFLPLQGANAGARRSSLETRQEAEAHYKGDPLGATTHCEMDDGWHIHILTLVVLLL